MEESKDVSTILDEDVLRKMWQTTEDFSRRKEIRAHMYKLREARLKEFYTSGEVLRDVQRSNSSPGLREQPCVKDEGPTHADSLADHSFLSLKTKEIRDSESPTRDVQFRNSKNREADGQWTIQSSTSKSPDGKTITSSQTATTQGVRAIDNGQIAYVAANEQKASVFADGDDQNFTRAVGESSKTFAEENLVSGDENNYRSSKSTTKSSSSRMVTESRNTSGDFRGFDDNKLAITAGDETDFISGNTNHTSNKKSTTTADISENMTSKVASSVESSSSKSQIKDGSTKITKTTYTSGEIPDDLKKSIADGNTKVYTETKTLPDGSVVTTTRYETKGSKKFTSGGTSRQTFETVEQKSAMDNRTSKQVEHISEGENVIRTVSTKKVRDEFDDDRRNKSESVKISTEVYTDNLKRKGETQEHKVTKTKEVPETKETYTTIATKEIQSNITEDNLPAVKRVEPSRSSPNRPQKIDPVKSCKPEETYKPSSPTEGQYSTTYQSEFTNKRISVDVSATHDAFARSLRSVSPDRVGGRPKSNTTSTTSLRSSTSPDKYPIGSPDRKGSYNRPSPEGKTYDKKRHNTSPSRCTTSPNRDRTSPKRDHTSPKRDYTGPKKQSEYSPERKSPERKPSRPDTITISRRRPSGDRIQSFSPTSPSKTDITINRTTKVTRSQTSPTKPGDKTSPLHSPTKENDTKITRNVPKTDRTSPLTSPSKEVNSDTITRRKKVTDETCTTKTEVNSDTITKKKKVTDDDGKRSPVRSPTKFTAIETINTDYNTNTITKKKKPSYENSPNTDTITKKQKAPQQSRTITETTVFNTDTIIRKKSDRSQPTNRTDIDVVITETSAPPNSQDLSPTSLASDFEFINHNRHIITDLDEPVTSVEVTETVVTKKDISKKEGQKSPRKETTSPIKEVPKMTKSIPSELDSSEKPPITFSPEDFEQICEVTPEKPKEKPPLKRTETYEERCRQILGLPEPDTIAKKDYDDMYAGMEPVEEPMFTKKTVYKVGPDDDLMEKNVEKISRRRQEIDNVTQVTDEFISKENKNTESKNPEKMDVSKKSRKSPEKTPKPDGEYNTEYTDEFCDKPSKKPSGPERKPSQKKIRSPKEPTEDKFTTEYIDQLIEPSEKVTTKVTETFTTTVEKKSPSSSSKPTRKSPEKKSPTETVSTRVTETITTTVDKKSPNREQIKFTKSTSPERKPARDTPEKKTDRKIVDEKVTTTTTSSKSPEKKPESPKKKQEMTFSTEYTDEYCEDTNKIDYKKPAGKKTEPNKPSDIAPIKTTGKKLSKKPKSKNQDDSSTEEEIEEFIVTETTEVEDKLYREVQNRGIPGNNVTDYINDYEKNISKPTNGEDFINKEKFDTDITLEITKNIAPTHLTEVEFDLENENIQKSHIRTHRIDTTKEITSKRVPQKAVPSDTMECTFDIISTNKQVTPKKPEEGKISKKPQKYSPVDDKKLPKKDSSSKITSNVKTVTKKSSSTEIDVRKVQDIPKKKEPANRIPKEKSPDKLKQRSPSPTRRTIKKTESEKSITRKTSNKDLPVKKPLPKTSEPSRQTYTTSPERKPSKPCDSTPERKPFKPSESFTNKHVVSKTISVTSPKPQSVKTEIKSTPKTITRITKTTQPSSITTVKTTKTTKKTMKPQKPEDSGTESDTEVVDVRVDRRKVVTTTNIKMNNGAKQPNVTVPSFKRSTSSREPSPEKVCPVPVSSEDEGSYPRYPDKVSEPDDSPSRKKKNRISEIPLYEDKDEVTNFERFTEVFDVSENRNVRITDIDKVTEEDESLLSVTEKVSKFITTAEKLAEDEPKSKTPAPKVPRPELVIDERLENDECLLSVSDKVSKFITTAEKVKNETPKTTKPKEKVPVEIKVNENDECLLNVNQKVSHFIQAAETAKQTPSRDGPAPKVSRPEFKIDETLQTDDCILSVSDKVNKFLTTAEKLTSDTRKTEIICKSPDKITKVEITLKREPSPEKPPIKRNDLPERSRQSPPRRMPESCEVPEKSRQSPVRKTPDARKSPEKLPEKPENIKPLKSSEAVKKAKAMFENITKEREVSRQKDILSRPSIWEGRKRAEKPESRPERKPEDDAKLADIGVYKKKEEVKKQLIYPVDTCPRIKTDYQDVSLKSTKLILNESKNRTRLSPEKEPSKHSTLFSETTRPRSKSPVPGEVPHYMLPIQKHAPLEPEGPTHVSRSSIPSGETPHYMQPIQKHLPDEPEGPINRSRSPYISGETPGYMRPIQKHLPEQPERTVQRVPYSGETPHYMLPIQKYTSEERDTFTLETRYRETISPEKEKEKLYQNGDTPHYMLPLDRSVSPDREVTKKGFETVEITEKDSRLLDRDSSRDVPGYMKPLHKHTHTHNIEDNHTGQEIVEDGTRAEKKFGVTLRRTDSGRMVNITERRKSSTPGQPIIEEIEDLEVLEKMMDKVVGYEQRSRIRAQIRVVKKLISENKMHKTKKSYSPTRISPVSKSSSPNEDRRSPIRETKRSTSPIKTTEKMEKTTATIRQKSPESKTRTFETKSSFSSVTTTQKSEKITSRSSKERSLSPEPKKKSPQINRNDLRSVQTSSKSVQDDKPSWVTNRNLKKASSESVERKTVVSSKKIEKKRSPSPQKETKTIDCITSSYGIGPTDENGLPLFGIRALRKAADNSKTQIRGTVVTSEYYSENGQEPVGEITVTKYSNNPKELNIDDENINKSKGIASVSMTQKFGAKGTPTLTSLTDKRRAITSKQSNEDEILKTTSTKVTRRGSVKALSQKFIDNAVETTKNEKNAYPKAGLILRTSSFKETTQSSAERTSRESSPGYTSRPEKISLESLTSASRSQSERVCSSSTKTFLNSHTRVTNAQDVITRMKNAETEHIEGDSAEDREARMLLNKFLGAQVLMSGMEPLLGKQSTVTGSSTTSSSAQLVRKMQTKSSTSSTTKESSKPSLTKRYQTPITAEILQDIWDEQTLRALLEQCTDYEERRAIRARLRQVMAEQEAVANVVANACSDSTQERIETTKKSFSEGPVTTTQMTTTRVVQQSKQISKPISPFAKFRQLDKQHSLNTPPSSPKTPTGAPLFKFTDPTLCQSASTVKERLLHWCQMKTKEYENIKLDNFSTSWSDGMAFCALIHHFLPEAFDYHALNPKQRRHNFTLAFNVADEQAGIAPLLDVDDMVAMRKPDWKCVFTYVQSIYRRFKDDD